ncbi:sensor histidine kinase [Streptomyces syringium]|uniref:sensor histidine kinase n=1 Tax=Streptomyces syringium TaxID=76729 RepID=UPI003451AFB5
MTSQADRIVRNIETLFFQTSSTVLRWVIDLLLAAVAVLDFRPWQDQGAWSEHILVAAATGAVLLRRRLPLMSFLVTLPALFTTQEAIAASVITLCTLARQRPDWRLAPSGLVLMIGNLFRREAWEANAPMSHPSPTFADWTEHLTCSLVVGAAPVALGLLFHVRQNLADRLTDLTAAHEQERLLLERAAVTRERAHISREMHDIVSHKAGLIAIQAGALEMTATDPGVRATALTLRRLAVSTLEELRSLLLVLRAEGAGPAELRPRSCLADLEALAAESGVEVSLYISPAVRARQLPERIGRTVYRTVQECLTNTRKHAPGAPLDVRIESDDTHLHVRACHDAAPEETSTWQRPLPGGGHGLLGLRERALLLDGELVAGPRQEGGFGVHLSVPLPSTYDQQAAP